MDSSELIQKAYTTILQFFVQNGRAPHYTELADVMNIHVDQARRLQREAAETEGVGACWLDQDTDYIEAWGPFSNIPTHHKLSIGSQQKWFAI